MRKKILLLLLSLTIVGATFVGCGSEKSSEGNGTNQEQVKDIVPDEVVEKILSEISVRAVAKIDDEMAKEIFKLNLEEIESYSIRKGQINTGLETVAIIKAKDGKIDNIKKSLEEYRTSMRPYPNEEEIIKDGQVVVNGNYIGFFIIPNYEEGQNNVEKAIDIFENSFK